MTTLTDKLQQEMNCTGPYKAKDLYSKIAISGHWTSKASFNYLVLFICLVCLYRLSVFVSQKKQISSVGQLECVRSALSKSKHLFIHVNGGYILKKKVVVKKKVASKVVKKVATKIDKLVCHVGVKSVCGFFYLFTYLNCG